MIRQFKACRGWQVVALCLLLVAPSVAAASLTAVFHNVPGVNGSQVPGMPGVSFDPGTGSAHFDRVFGSGNGNYAFTALTDLATTEDEVLIVNGVVVAREGTATSFAPGEDFGLFDTQIAINNAGSFAFANNTTGPTDEDEYIIQSVGGVQSVVAQESGPVSAIPGTLYGTLLDTPVITSTGTVGFRVNNITGPGITTDNDDIVVLGSTLIAQSGVTVPGNQAGGAVETWDIFDINDYFVSSDGSSYILQGDLNGATASDDVVVVNGDVVIQEDSVLTGFASPVNLVNGVYMDGLGNWYARGSNDDGQDWVLRNGVVVAATGESVTGGAELWSDAEFAAGFFVQTANDLGDYIIGGLGDGDPATDGILVLNGTQVVAREGDPVDLDGNGLFDDGAFISTFGNDDVFLANDMTLYVVANFVDANGATLGQGLLRTVVPEPSGLSLILLAGLVAAMSRRRG